MTGGLKGFDIGLAHLRRAGHFVYESGHHGDTWLELDPLFVDQRRLSTLAGELADRVRPHHPELICGPLVGGALVAQWVASHLDVPFIYTERIAPTALSGVRYRIPDALTALVAGRTVAIVDDAINAGSATLATREEIEHLGGQSTLAAAIFIRDPGGIQLLESLGLAVEHLVGVPFQIWTTHECPLCRAHVPLVLTP